MKLSIKPLLVLALSLALFACGDDDDPVASTTGGVDLDSIAEIAAGDERFEKLVELLQATGLDQTLADEDATFTVFAPTDEAFEALGQTTLDELANDADRLTDILLYHVTDSTINASAAVAAAGTKVTMVNEDPVAVSQSGNDLYINLSLVTDTDIEAGNGIIHVVNKVLIPPVEEGSPTDNIIETATANGNFTTLLSVLQTADLTSTLEDETQVFTVFAPTDDAFGLIPTDTLNALLVDTDALTDVLLQHVLVGTSVDSITAFTLNGTSVATGPGGIGGDGEDITINIVNGVLQIQGASVSITDIYTSNGVIHVLDAVITESVPAPNTIVDVAVGDDRFETLVSLLQSTGLDQTLADVTGTFTVFAPTDDAFAALGQATLDDLANDPDTLADILLYHVVSGSEIDSSAAIAAAGTKVGMANEDDITVSLNGSNLYINLSLVTEANISASNGIIHVVDAVLLPPADKGTPDQNIAEIATANADLETLVIALGAAGLDTTLADESQTFTVFAPTDNAFDIIDDTALTNLLGDTDALTGVLLQHVLIGSEVDFLTALTLNGSSVGTGDGTGEDVSIDLVDFRQFSNTTDDEVTYDATNGILVGGAGSSEAGFTLYTFDNDLGSSTSNCTDACATNWPPVLVTDGSVSSLPGLGTIVRPDSSIQVTYNGRPLYFYALDNAVGDINGQNLGGVWKIVELNPVVLQVQGATVTTKDVYANNGVIHIIDAVITETLQ